jgi:hypothetical protein
MQERIPPDRDATDDEAAATPNTFKIEKPMVQMQDLEHQRAPESRVSNKGVKVQPNEVNEVLPEPK